MNLQIKISTFISIFFISTIYGYATEQIKWIKETIGYEEEISTEQVINGLKEALEKGVSTGIKQVSKPDGYLTNPQIKIPFPPNIQKVEKTLRNIGLSNEINQFVKTLNQSAEKAATEAKPIFLNSIKQMNIANARDILNGNDKEGATNYLRKTTNNQLREKFTPIIKKALDQTNATKYYADIISSYNRIPFTDDLNTNLTAYTTEKAMEGLFFMIAKEEKKIRENPAERTTELLQKVFK